MIVNGLNDRVKTDQFYEWEIATVMEIDVEHCEFAIIDIKFGFSVIFFCVTNSDLSDQ